MKRSKKMQKNLEIRIKDYFQMVSQKQIGDGHRDQSGYKKPGGKTGSNK